MSAIVVTDNLQNIQLISGSFESLTGLKSDDLLGANIRRLLTQLLNIPLSPPVISFLESPRSNDLLCFTTDSPIELNACSLEISIRSLYSLSGDCIHLEIKENIQEFLLGEDEDKMSQLLIEHLKDYAIFLMDRNGYIISWNKGAQSIKGYEASEVIGKHVSILYTEESIAMHEPENNLKNAIDLGCYRTTGLRKRKDGSTFWADLTYTAIYNEQGILEGITKVTRDISQQKENEKRILNATTFLDTVLEHIPNMIFVKDAKELRFIRFNRAGEELLGYKRTDLIGKNDYDFFPKDQADFFVEKDREVLKEGLLHDIPEEPILTKDGQKWLHTKKIPIKNKDGSEYLLGISEDITERKKYDEALKKWNTELERNIAERTIELSKSERRFKALIENSGDGITIIDEHLEIIYESPTVHKLLGYFTEEKQTANLINYVHPEDRERMFEFISTVMEQPDVPKSFELKMMHKDGSSIWIEGTSNNLLYDESVQGIVLNFRNITERKITAEKIKASERLFRSIVLHIPQALVLVIDKNEHFLLLEGANIEKLGYKSKGYQNKHATEVVSEAQYKRSKPYYQRVLSGEQFTMDYNGNRGDHLLHFIPLKDDKNEVYAGLILILDMSDMKKVQHEIEELNRNLEAKVQERTAQLNAANLELESFSYSVSHDLRAPLRAIHGYTKILSNEYKDAFNEEGTQIMDAILYNSKRMGQLIDDLLSFSKLGKKELQLSKLNMNTLVAEICNELKPNYAEHTFIIEPLPEIEADYSLIRQVLINLLSNACKYSRESKKPRVTIKGIRSDTEFVFSINDNGVGFDMKFYDKLFGVFQRLHSIEQFEGTGVGLALVKRIMQRHNGKVWAEGIKDEGATFYFSFPLTIKSIL